MLFKVKGLGFFSGDLRCFSQILIRLSYSNVPLAVKEMISVNRFLCDGNPLLCASLTWMAAAEGIGC